MDLKLVTCNLRGVHFKDKKPGSRLKKETNIKSLADRHDVVMLQETHLGKKAGPYLKNLLPRHRTYCSGLSFTSGGVATVLSPSLATKFDVTMIKLPGSLQGRAIILKLMPKHGEGGPMVLVNVYIQSGDNYRLKKEQIEAISMKIPPSQHIYVAGDFNFVEDKERDSSSSANYYNPTRSFLEAWDEFKAKFKLKEVFQGSHTYFDIGKSSIKSSRLDRIYISMDESDWATLRPYAFIPCIPHSLITDKGALARTNNGISDHLPVAINCSPLPLATDTRGNTIPRWVAENPDFPKCFTARWGPTAIRLDLNKPFDVLSAFKHCMHEASKDILADQARKVKKFASSVDELTLLLKALRCHKNPNSDLAISFFNNNPQIGDCKAVKSRIDQLLQGAVVENTDRDFHPAVSRQLNNNDNINNIKLALPSTRSYLTALRADMGSEPTTDPNGMTEIAADYMSRLWQERDRSEEERISPDDYYGDFHRIISPDKIPAVPDIDRIRDAILSSGNSCPGPDGVSFAAWRAVVDHAAPVLHLVLKAMAGGSLPPEGFNHGLLFLIPKKGTLLPSDTRPISVTNADNRIIAKAVVASITPALLDTLHGSQKGFILGRHFEDHIRDLNDHFYEIVEADGEDNLFILFMDTAKAFDSIDHEFIHASILRSGLPVWFSNLVRALLHQVCVRPAFRGGRTVWIKIKRGVKQGCPLSPLLFVICYDVLLHRIDSLQGVSPYACADDLAVAASVHSELWPVMKLVDNFRDASGLGVNTDKTKIISAKEVDISRCFRPVSLVEYMNRCPWRDVKVVNTYCYLGVLFGREVTTHDIFRAATKGLIDRTQLYRPALRSFSHSSRIFTYNTFIITKISYLIKFFHLPFSTKASASAEGKIKARAWEILLPIRAAYHYSFLISPTSRTSPGVPARDAWAWALATLVDQCDLHQWHGQGDVDGSVDFHPEDYESMRISRHIRSAGAEFVCRVTAHTGTAFDAEIFDLEGGTRRKAIYWWLFKTDYELDADRALAGVLTSRALVHCDQLVDILHTNFSLLPQKFPPYLRCAQFDLITNCLFTDRRFRSFKTQNYNARSIRHSGHCYVCGKGEDSVEHLYGGQCEPIVAARSLVPKMLSYYGEGKVSFPDLDADSVKATDFWATSLLAFPRPGHTLPDKVRKNTVLALTIFNGTVWYERVYHFRLLDSPPDLQQAADRLASMVALEYLRLQKRRAGSQSTPSKQERKLIAREHALAMIRGLDSSALVAFTDGSANPNPGPAGAGVYVYSNSAQYPHEREAFAALGQSTNNVGELWAIGMALQISIDTISSYPPNTFSSFRVFTDSAFAKACVLGDWKSSKYKGLVDGVANLLRDLCALIEVRIDWVPAHVGIDANEHADFLAGLGTERSKRGLVDVDIKQDFKAGSFIPERLLPQIHP